MFLSILEMVLPVAIMFFLGWLCNRKQIFSPAGLSGIKTLVGNVLLPVVLFNAFFTAEYSGTIALTFATVYGCCALGLGLGFLLRRFVPDHGRFAPFLMTNFEGGMMGYALFGLLYAGQTKEMKDGRLLSKADGPEHGKTFLERLDKQPSFKGLEGQEGAKAFSKWVSEHVQRPEGLSGVVEVGYAIGRKGNIQEVQVLKSACPELDEEVVRVVKSAPKWKPGVYDGNPIRLPGDVKIVFTGE